MSIRLSVIVPVLNSHEIVRRQILHWAQMPLPEDVEVIYMDDGSDPPLRVDAMGLEACVAYQKMHHRLHIIPTGDTREWTWAVARNSGARSAQGEYLLMTDIDYILPKEAIHAALAFDGDYLGFKRQFGVLDEFGQFTQDMKTLLRYGLEPNRAQARGVQLPPHPNNFVIRKRLFFEMGMYPEDRVGTPYPQGEDSVFKRRRHEWVAAGRMTEVTDERRPLIFMFPNGQFCGDVDFNPFGLFHGQSRKTSRNHWYTHPRSHAS